jgi:VanZ family protein
MHSWVGEIRRATAEAGGITVDHLDPGGYELPSGRLAKPLTNLIVERSDVVLNVLGFLPFGTLFAVLRPARRVVVRAAVASLVVSAVMEVGQLVVVTRDPSVLDLALNTLGGALGGVLAAAAVALGRRRSPAR